MEVGRFFYTEDALREYFEKNLKEFGVKKIILSQRPCPDYVVEMEDGEILKIEAELFAENFKIHRHDPSKADLILACYSKVKEVKGVPVRTINKLWSVSYSEEDVEDVDSKELSKDEIEMLKFVAERPGTSFAELSRVPDWEGKNQLYLSISPEEAKRIFWGIKDERTVFESLGVELKNYVKKYGHCLIGFGMSDKACEILESLWKRKLIRSHPSISMVYLLDGRVIVHEGWLPVVIWVTEKAKKEYPDFTDPRKLLDERRGRL